MAVVAMVEVVCVRCGASFEAAGTCADRARYCKPCKTEANREANRRAYEKRKGSKVLSEYVPREEDARWNWCVVRDAYRECPLDDLKMSTVELIAMLKMGSLTPGTVLADVDGAEWRVNERYRLISGTMVKGVNKNGWLATISAGGV